MTDESYRVHVDPEFIRNLAEFFRPHRLSLFDLSDGSFLAGDPAGDAVLRRVASLSARFPALFRVDSGADADSLCEVLEADGLPCALAFLSAPPEPDRSEAGRRRFRALCGLLSAHLTDRLRAESAHAKHAELKRRVEILLRHVGPVRATDRDLERTLGELLDDLIRQGEIDGGFVWLSFHRNVPGLRGVSVATEAVERPVIDAARVFVGSLRGPVHIDETPMIDHMLGVRTPFKSALAAPVGCAQTGNEACPLRSDPESGDVGCPCWSGGIFLYSRGQRSFMRGDRKFVGLLVERLVGHLFGALLLSAQSRASRLGQEIRLAREIQRNLLPRHPPDAPHLQVATHSLYARTVGGDFYDFHHPREHVLLVAVGDISGKSVPAALLHSMIQRALHGEMARYDGFTRLRAGEILRRVNAELYTALATVDMFATLLLCRFDTRAGRLEFANAGHVPALLRRAATGATECLTLPGVPIGFLPDADYETTGVDLAPGDLLLLYTDGLTETFDEKRNFFGVERLVRSLEDASGLPVDGALARIVAAAEAFSGDVELVDDRTAVLVRYAPAASRLAAEPRADEAPVPPRPTDSQVPQADPPVAPKRRRRAAGARPAGPR